MAIKKKTILTDNLPQSPLTTPVLTNNISIPFALGYPANVTVPLVIQPATFARPTQAKGFDLTTTQLKIPNPIYLNDLNGIFNLYSGALNDLCSGTPIQFDPSYIINRQSYNNQNPAPNPQIPTGYPLDAILFSYPNNAWFRSLSANNIDPSLNLSPPAVNTAKWQQITNIQSVQRLTWLQTDKGATAANPATRTLIVPPNAIGVLLSATAFGGNGGIQPSGSTYTAGGGGAGGGVNNMYFTVSLSSYTVSYSNNALSLPFGLGTSIVLTNGLDGGSSTGSAIGIGGIGGSGAGGGINAPTQTLGRGIDGSPTNQFGGNGGVSSLSNGVEIRATGGREGVAALSSQVFGGGGGGGGYGIGGKGGVAAVIAEWVFP